MRPAHVASYILRDLQGMGLRLPLAVCAGVLALAVATVIDTLNLAFARQAEVLMERAMKQVRTVANTLYVRPRDAGHFSSSQFEKLMDRVCNLERRGELLDVSTVVESVEQDIFRLENWRGKSKEMHGISIWSVPSDAAFLRSVQRIEGGLVYHAGGQFSQKDPTSACSNYQAMVERRTQPTDTQDQAPGREWSDTFRPRLGVIVNARYLKRYRAYGEDDTELFAQAIRERDFPKSIGIKFLADADTELLVTGVIHEPVAYYPDLIFTESLAGAFFEFAGSVDTCSQIRRRGRITSHLAARLDQWETGEPLIWLTDTPDPPKLIPVKDGKIAYPQFRDSHCEPYDLVIVRLRHWREEEARSDLQEELLRPLATLTLDGDAAAALIELASLAAARDDSSGSSQSLALDNLKELLVSHVDPSDAQLPLEDMVTVEQVGTAGGVFHITDVAGRRILELSQNPDTKDIVIDLTSAWRVDVPAKELVTTVLRQRNLMQTYALAMTVIVIVLVVCTSFLLSFGHVLRKTRDIGVLLTNGACRSAIFAIYLGQIAVMVVAGCVLGIAFAFGAEPLAEVFARGMMDRLLAALPEQGDAAVADVLDLNLRVLGAAVTTITVSALGGAVLPVFLATRFDPLSSLGKGD